MSEPIVFIHQGDHDFLKYALYQAKISNPRSKVFLIGDERNRQYDSSLVEHVMIQSYDEDVELFHRLYKHQSGNSFQFELFCIQRLFVLRNFLVKNRIKRSIYQDSDVLLYYNADKLSGSGCDIVFNHWGIRSAADLVNLCSFTLNQYYEPGLFQRLVQYSQRSGGDMSDMTLMDYYREHVPGSIVHMSMVARDGLFCGNILLDELCETICHKKMIYMLEGKIYCKYLPDQRWVPMHSLHFQGSSKLFMQHVFLSNMLDPGERLYFDYDRLGWVPVPG